MKITQYNIKLYTNNTKETLSKLEPTYITHKSALIIASAIFPERVITFRLFPKKGDAQLLEMKKSTETNGRLKLTFCVNQALSKENGVVCCCLRSLLRLGRTQIRGPKSVL